MSIKIPMDDVPNYTSEQLELSDTPEIREELTKFVKANFKTFSLGDMAHVLGVRTEILMELLPWGGTRKDLVQHSTNMVVVLQPKDSAKSDALKFEEGLI